VIAEARLHREGHGDPEPLHVEFGEPRIAISPIKRSILTRSRHWQEWQDKRKAAEAARRAVEAEHDLGLVDGVTFRRRSEPAAGSERADGPVPGDSGLRIRGGGPIVGIW
jgi:hypothetical protein